MEIHFKSMEIHRHQLKSIETRKTFISNPWKSVVVHGNPWKLMEIQTNFEEIYSFPKKFVVIHGVLCKTIPNQWKSMQSNGNQQKSMELHTKSMEIYGDP